MPSASKKKKQYHRYVVPQALKENEGKRCKGVSFFTSSRRQALKNELKNEINETEN